VRGALALCGLWSKPLIGLAEGCPVKARVWCMPVAPGCEWPELAELPRLRGTANVGIAMSGGGLRACMQDLGVVMALHDQGLLGRARYISGNSGGSWFTAALGFLPEDRSLEAFLAPGLLPPSALSMKVLGDLPQGSFARVASEPVVASGGPPAWLEDQFSQGGARGYLDAFAADMARRFLAPFGLFKPRSVISTEPGTEGHRRALEAVGHADVQVTPARGDMPFPILNAAIRSEVAGWLPLEFTPLYAGTPVRLRGPDGHEGGGAVEAFAAGCPAPHALEQGGSAVGDGEEVVVSPEHFLPLPFAMGASSNVRPLLRQRWPESDLLPEGQRKDPVMQLWSPADIRSGRGGLKQVADGYASDNNGLLALLRRCVDRAIIMIPHHVPVTHHDYANEVWWSAFFGALGRDWKGLKAHDVNRHQQVFDRGCWEPLLEELRGLANNGRPTTVASTLDVLPNARCGVEGGYKLRAIFVCASLSEEYLAQLPEDTQAALQRTARPDESAQERPYSLDASFPYLPTSTSAGDFDAPLCALLAQSAAHNLLACRETLHEFFEAEAEGPPAEAGGQGANPWAWTGTLLHRMLSPAPAVTGRRRTRGGT